MPVSNACIPASEEVDAGGSAVQSQPGLLETVSENQN